MELLREGKAAGPDEDGEVVLTHLDAWGMPFVRYRTGDVARAGDGGICAGGRFILRNTGAPIKLRHPTPAVPSSAAKVAGNLFPVADIDGKADWATQPVR